MNIHQHMEDFHGALFFGFPPFLEPFKPPVLASEVSQAV
jgi:hypothetical protein